MVYIKKFGPIILAALVHLNLSGCGGIISELHGIPIVDPTNFSDVAAHTKGAFDRHENKYLFQGPVIYAQKNITGHVYLLRAWAKQNEKKEQIAFGQLYVIARLDDWAFLREAYSEGTRLHLSTIDREVGSCHRGHCTVTETVGINFTIPQIEALSEKVLFSVKITGRKGSIFLDVPGAYFYGFLEGIRSLNSNNR